ASDGAFELLSIPFRVLDDFFYQADGLMIEIILIAVGAMFGGQIFYQNPFKVPIYAHILNAWLVAKTTMLDFSVPNGSSLLSHNLSPSTSKS
ncbi:MAG: hypothetical protein L0Y75_01580, partial [Acidobacteria bacterium]|nr:hypothetical protein [Acidobacteriota bacterium]